MDLKDKVKDLCERNNVSVRKLEIALGIANGSVKNWDKVTPSFDKIMALSRFFNVNPEYFLDDDAKLEYYIDPEVTKLAQQIADNPELRVLFDASKKLKKKDVQFVLDMIERMKR